MSTSVVLPFYRFRTDIVTPASEYPIDLAGLKAHLRITSADDDAYLTSMIPAIVEMGEQYMRRRLLTTELAAYADDAVYLQPWWQGIMTGARAVLSLTREFVLPWMPLQSVEALKLYARQDPTPITVDASGYLVDVSTRNQLGRIALKLETVLSVDPREINALGVEYTVGYESAGDIPPPIITGLYVLGAFMYNNRGDCGGQDPIKASSADAYLRPYRLMTL